jgi:hypothetical protein
VRRSPLALVTVACLVVGVGLMIPFEATVTRILGTGCLLAFVVCGAFLVANPEDLGRDEDGGDSWT